jgi:hypothetical protein
MISRNWRLLAMAVLEQVIYDLRYKHSKSRHVEYRTAVAFLKNEELVNFYCSAGVNYEKFMARARAKGFNG